MLHDHIELYNIINKQIPITYSRKKKKKHLIKLLKPYLSNINIKYISFLLIKIYIYIYI